MCINPKRRKKWLNTGKSLCNRYSWVRIILSFSSVVEQHRKKYIYNGGNIQTFKIIIRVLWITLICISSLGKSCVSQDLFSFHKIAETHQSRLFLQNPQSEIISSRRFQLEATSDPRQQSRRDFYLHFFLFIIFFCFCFFFCFHRRAFRQVQSTWFPRFHSLSCCRSPGFFRAKIFLC